MSVIVPITRRDFVLRPSVALVPLPARMAADPVVTEAAWALGIDAGVVEWGGGITLMTPLTAGAGRVVSVHARAELPAAGTPVRDLLLFAPGRGQAASARFLLGEGLAPVSLRLRVLRSQVMAAVVCHRDGRLRGVIAEVRVLT